MKYLNFYIFAFAFILLTSMGCKKEESNTTPTIAIKSGSDFTSDGSFLTNHKAKLGITADGGGSNITNLVIKISKKDTTITLVDEGYNDPSIDITKLLQVIQGDRLTWSITVMNKDRNTASLSFFTRDTTKTFGEILTFQGVEMGMQNSTTGPMFNPFTGDIFTPQSVAGHEADIHILTYYYISSGLPSYTFSSAGDQDAPTYIPSVAGWGIKNYTDWDYVTVVSTADFDASTNDSLLVTSFHSGAGFSSRKYKWADVGKVIPFKTTNGKVGLIKVNSVANAESGTINFDLKIQK